MNDSIHTFQPVSHIVARYDEIKAGLNIIRQNTLRIQNLKDQETQIVNEDERRKLIDEANHVMSETTKECGTTKKALDLLTPQSLEVTTSVQISKNMYNSHMRQLHTAMSAFNIACRDFKDSVDQRNRRQLAAFGIDIHDNNSGQLELSDVLISERLDLAVVRIEDRYEGIMRLEKQINEIYQLFQDLAMLVELQQETIDVIESHVDRAVNYQTSALSNMADASKYQQSARKKQCCILGILLTVVFVIVMLFLVVNK